MHRTPALSEALAVFLRGYGGRIGTVLDVGAQARTPFLMDTFADAHHVLFEPVQAYHEALRANYTAAGISHTVVGVALSDRAGSLHQHLISADGSGSVTHSQLLEAPDPQRFGARLVRIEPTPVRTLDDWAAEHPVGAEFLVKLDVDGIEERIIEGGATTIRRCALLIVEAPMPAVARRIACAEALGLRLFDIAGNGYYFDQLHQVDLVFVADRLLDSTLALRPFEHTPQIDWKRWQSYSR